MKQHTSSPFFIHHCRGGKFSAPTSKHNPPPIRRSIHDLPVAVEQGGVEGEWLAQAYVGQAEAVAYDLFSLLDDAWNRVKREQLFVEHPVLIHSKSHAKPLHPLVHAVSAFNQCIHIYGRLFVISCVVPHQWQSFTLQR